MSKHRLLFATSNRGKLREVRALLEGMDLDLLSLEDFSNIPEAIEDGATFEDNARKKALHYHQWSHVVTLADDSGLEVDLLNGAPGVHSARFAGTQSDDAANNAKLISRLQGIPIEQRTARFRCVMALASGGNVVATSQGAVEGLMIDEARGEQGFGYDPHFLLPELGLTKAQLSLEIKNQLSHRGQALRGMLPAIQELFRL